MASHRHPHCANTCVCVHACSVRACVCVWIQTYLSQHLCVCLSLQGGHHRHWQWPNIGEQETRQEWSQVSLGYVTVMWAHTYTQYTLYSGDDLSEYMVRASAYSECSRTNPRHSSNFSGPKIRDVKSLFLLHCSSLHTDHTC